MSLGILQEMSNFYCHPGRAGGSPMLLEGARSRAGIDREPLRVHEWKASLRAWNFSVSRETEFFNTIGRKQSYTNSVNKKPAEAGFL
jgi:hypothetical protein